MDIALNVGRSRLNVLSIALALYLFMVGVFISLGQEYEVRPVWVFLTSFVPICLGFALSMMSLMLFLLSQRLSSDMTCEIWSFSCAELLMYLAMAQTLSGCLQNFVIAIEGALGVVAVELAMGEATSAALSTLAQKLTFWLLLATGLVWTFVIYVAPTVFLLRIAIPWQRKWVLALGYIATLAIVFWISAYPFQMKARADGRPGTVGGFFVRQLWQPALWPDGAPDFQALEPRSTETRPLVSE